MKFVKKYSIRPLLDLKAEVVREGDTLEYGIENNKPYITYKPLPFNAGKVIGAFAVAYFKDGGVLYEVMNLDEINKVRKVSKAGSSASSPWATWGEEMYKKTCLRRLCKALPTDFDNIEQRNAWDEGSGVDFTKPEAVEVHDPFADQNEEIADEIVIDTEVVNETPIDEMPMPDAFREVR